VQREYLRILNSRFIRAQNQSVYQPQEKNPKGEVHEDLGVFSFDSTRKRLVFRQFHKEGSSTSTFTTLHRPTRSCSRPKRSKTSPPAGARAKRMSFMARTNSKRSSSSPSPGRTSRCTRTPDCSEPGETAAD
jgi:hypothetical protein